MNKSELVEEFKGWLNEKTPDSVYCSTNFIENKVNMLLSLEADGDTIFENDEIVVGAYDYTYELPANKSLSGQAHSFSFKAIGVGCKENVTANDYELADYNEAEFIIRQK